MGEDKRLFRHAKYDHVPQNVNVQHAAKLAASGINTRIAVALTKGVGTGCQAREVKHVGQGCSTGGFVVY